MAKSSLKIRLNRRFLGLHRLIQKVVYLPALPPKSRPTNDPACLYTFKRVFNYVRWQVPKLGQVGLADRAKVIYKCRPFGIGAYDLTPAPGAKPVHLILSCKTRPCPHCYARRLGEAAEALRAAQEPFLAVWGTNTLIPPAAPQIVREEVKRLRRRFIANLPVDVRAVVVARFCYQRLDGELVPRLMLSALAPVDKEDWLGRQPPLSLEKNQTSFGIVCVNDSNGRQDALVRTAAYWGSQLRSSFRAELPGYLTCLRHVQEFTLIGLKPPEPRRKPKPRPFTPKPRQRRSPPQIP